MSSSTKGALAALFGFSLYALHDALIKDLAHYSVFQILFFAVLFSHIPFTFYLVADEGSSNLRPRQPFWVGLRALCIVASASLAFFAFGSLPLAQTYAVLFLMPMLVTLIAIPMLGERIRLFRGFAILLGLSGVIVALQPNPETIQWGHLSALAAAFCSALAAVITRKIGNTERGAVLILYPLLANVLLSGFALGFVYQMMPLGDLAKMAAIGGLGIFGQVIIIYAYRSAPAAVVAPFQYSQLMWAVIYGIWWFDETPDRHVFIGGGIIILAGLLVVWRESVGASKFSPFLRSRNHRSVSGPLMPSIEIDERRRDDAR